MAQLLILILVIVLVCMALKAAIVCLPFLLGIFVVVYPLFCLGIGFLLLRFNDIRRLVSES